MIVPYDSHIFLSIASIKYLIINYSFIFISFNIQISGTNFYCKENCVERFSLNVVVWGFLSHEIIIDIFICLESRA